MRTGKDRTHFLTCHAAGLRLAISDITWRAERYSRSVASSGTIELSNPSSSLWGFVEDLRFATIQPGVWVHHHGGIKGSLHVVVNHSETRGLALGTAYQYGAPLQKNVLQQNVPATDACELSLIIGSNFLRHTLRAAHLCTVVIFDLSNSWLRGNLKPSCTFSALFMLT
jgi:hypothetical protein